MPAYRVWCKRLMQLVSMGVLLAGVAFAQVPHLVRYQGQAVDSHGIPLEGPYVLTFRLYDATTGWLHGLIE